jgi:hypothetical protein
MVVVFDNRRMAAISGLQHAQYGIDFRTHDSVAVDYVQFANSVADVQAHWGGGGREVLRAALRTTASRWCMSPCMPARRRREAWEPGATGTSATGAATCRRYQACVI